MWLVAHLLRQHNCQDLVKPWRRHYMKILSLLLALCEGNPLVTSGFPSKWVSDTGLWFYLILGWSNCWINSRVSVDLRCYDARVTSLQCFIISQTKYWELNSELKKPFELVLWENDRLWVFLCDEAKPHACTSHQQWEHESQHSY